MMKNTSRSRLSVQDILMLSRHFAKKEDGMVTIFACMMIFCMLMIGGIGVDMMRHEMERTRIQSVADRAVLAAADLDQTLSPEAVVRDYFAKSGMADFVSSVDVDQTFNQKTVTVDASTDVNTMFMDYMGVQTLNVPAVSTATEKMQKVEISLVLDISGSMGWNGKMQNLQDAAGTFLDTVLTPENRNLISVSLAPYTAHTNAGPYIFQHIDTNQTHDWSHCIEFEDDDFDNTFIYFGNTPDRQPYDHMQHFMRGWNWPGWHGGADTISNPSCPKEDFETVYAFSQNAQDLKDRINALQPRANTAIHLGMKWGVAMLNPEWRKFNAVLPPEAGVDPAFVDRPADFYNPEAPQDNETIKTVVLMTDGENVYTQRIANRYYQNYNHWVHWSKYPLDAYLNRYVRSNDHWRWRYTKYTPSQADDLLNRVCNAAKNRGIVIWTIAFEAPTHGENVMRNCASSPSHFFAVDGDEITDAFGSIANSINQLRLTQ